MHYTNNDLYAAKVLEFVPCSPYEQFKYNRTYCNDCPVQRPLALLWVMLFHWFFAYYGLIRGSRSSYCLIFCVYFLFLLNVLGIHSKIVLGQTNAEFKGEQIEHLLKRIEELESRLSELEKEKRDKTVLGKADEKFEEEEEIDNLYKKFELEKEKADERQEEFDLRLFEIEDKIGDKSLVSIFDAERLNLGGFISTNFTSMFKDDDNWSAIDNNHLELVIAPRITENLNAFFSLTLMTRADWDNSVVEANNPNGVAMPPQSLTSKRKFDNLKFKNALLIGWGEWNLTDWFNIRFGRYVTPWGIRNIEHFQPLFLAHSSPLFLRNLNLNQSILMNSPIIASSLQGLDIKGTFGLGENSLEYSAYAGSSQATESPELDTNRLENIVTGARLAYSFYHDIFTFGTNFQHGRRGNVVTLETDDVGRMVLKETDYDAWGLDFKVNYRNFGLKAEFIRSSVEDAPDQIGGYILPYFTLWEKWVPFYRFDYVDLRTDISGVPDLTERLEHTFGLNFLPHPLLRIRGEFILGDSKADRDPLFLPDPGVPDFKAINISATLSF
ncbi:MAG: hypothetical protein SCARUB_02768 [Candidatus Scalindua rubra]|uniref:Phosphate-selective porin O and P n=1 Tax=Candidatus Scalindua rubra TaxID=1872076 RepID=A0A1E3X929_9BACT|nr:MAG: hypothetical protein SCARUB_02768 [Candidatus Scalindua rubra]